MGREQQLLSERLLELEAELEVMPELYSRLDAALAELELTRGELEAMQREHARLSEVVASISDSVSWRLTAPLRSAMTLVRR